MKHFELWLDESGKFEDTKELQELHSFVGGVLVEKEAADQVDMELLLDNEQFNHAMNLYPNQKKKYVFPKLVEFKEKTQARYVYFENIELFGNGDNRDLYLQVMAEGLLQLTQLLEAKFGPIELSIIIASRVAKKDDRPFVHITEDEYRRVFNALLSRNKERNEIALSKNTQIHFHLERATQSLKLILADFASNTRRVYQKRDFRDAKSGQAFNTIFQDAFVFSMTELSSDVRLRILLAQNDIAEALMEVFQSPTLYHKNDYLELIIERMQHLNYRIQKSQLKQASAEILSYTARQDSYSDTIKLLQRIDDVLIPLLKKYTYPYESFEQEVYLQLSDAYLRSGHFLKAREVLERAQGQFSAQSPSLENIFGLYRLMEKIAVFYIDSYQYGKAAELMTDIRQLFENIMLDIEDSSIVSRYFRTIQSEYYGDVLCMEIYAKLFMKNQDMEELRFLSDLGLEQYPGFEGELERHRQYRSRLEAQAGQYQLALNWLIKAILYEQDLDSPFSPGIIKEFWDKIMEQETEISQLFYLMYYTLILNSAVDDEPTFAEKMYHDLASHSISQLVLSEGKAEAEEYLVKNEPQINVHPKEIIYWNLADYALKTNDFGTAMNFYNQALNVCENDKSIISLQFRTVAILAARASLEVKMGKSASSYKKALSRLTSLKTKLCQVEDSDTISLSDAKATVSKWEQTLSNQDTKGENFAQDMWRFAQEWRY